MAWTDEAARVIREVHRSLPDNATLDERAKAVDAAYPFGLREHFPYKAWLKERRRYLGLYGYRGVGTQAALSPMARRLRKARA